MFHGDVITVKLRVQSQKAVRKVTGKDRFIANMIMRSLISFID